MIIVTFVHCAMVQQTRRTVTCCVNDILLFQEKYNEVSQPGPRRWGLSCKYQIDAGPDNLLRATRGMPQEIKVQDVRPRCPNVGQPPNKELEFLSGDFTPEARWRVSPVPEGTRALPAVQNGRSVQSASAARTSHSLYLEHDS